MSLSDTGGQLIRNNDFLYGVYELRKLTSDRSGVGVIRHTRPILLVA